MAIERSFAKLRAEVRQLEEAAEARLRDAQVLQETGRSAASILMGLYAVEIQLKIAICRHLDLDRLPRPFEIHDLEELLILSGLSKKISAVKRPRDVSRNWERILVISHSAEHIRYRGESPVDPAIASEFMDRLTNPTSGVLSWLRKQRRN